MHCLNFLGISDLDLDIIEYFIRDIDWEQLASAQSAYADSAGKAEETISKGLANILHYRYADSQTIFTAFEDIFFSSDKKKPRSRLGTKTGVQKKHLWAYEYITELAAQYLEIYQKKQHIDIHQITSDITLLMSMVFEYYQAIKLEKSLFDFDDLIDKTRQLLCDNEVSEWVLFKLDGGIDHILVDEAQDTAPEQWDIVKAIATNFFAPDDMYDQRHRTIFAVGDEKQSIYRFQGADPYQMAISKDYFSKAADYAQKDWLSTSLKGSFRSAPGIMKLVDSVFSAKDAADGVCFDPDMPVEHHAVANEGPAYIRLNPPVRPVVTEEEEVWTAPLDKPSPEDAKAIVARSVVKQIKELLSSQTILPSTGKMPQPKDILILLRKRGMLQKLLIKELKKHNIPVAGADRISLLDNIAVMDMLAVADFILFPEDDLNLATILKSPLCGFNEEELFDLAYNRHGSLWSTLIKRKEEVEIFGRACQFLQLILSKADFIAPYEFLSMILSQLEGRKKFRAQLGDECLDALDELLNKALSFERDFTPSLQGFVHYVRHYGSDIKRDAEQASNEIRIMTVHGSKGLESPIVFLPDTADKPTSMKFHEALVMPEGMEMPLWLKGVSDLSEQLTLLKKELQQEEDREYRRLLYVALTRAKDHIYIDGALRKPSKEGGKVSLSDKSWYYYIMNGIKNMEGVIVTQHDEETEFPLYEYRDMATVPEPLLRPIEESGKIATEESIIPEWAKRIDPDFVEESDEEEDDVTYVAPSNIDKDIKADVQSFKRGIIIHKIIELLPRIAEDKRETLIQKSLESYDLTEVEKTEIFKELSRFLNHDFVSVLFNMKGVSEASIAGRPQSLQGTFVKGQIDRMIVLEDKIILADYKTDRQMKEGAQIKNSYILQMAFYREALKDLYPNKSIETMLLGTYQPSIHMITDMQMDDALSDYLAKQTLRKEKRDLKSNQERIAS